MNKKEASSLFKVLGDENRLKIIKRLYTEGEKNVTSLLEIVDCGQSTLSFHLNVMLEYGLVFSKRLGKNIIYFVNTELLKELMNFVFEPCKHKDDGESCCGGGCSCGENNENCCCEGDQCGCGCEDQEEECCCCHHNK